MAVLSKEHIDELIESISLAPNGSHFVHLDKTIWLDGINFKDLLLHSGVSRNDIKSHPSFRLQPTAALREYLNQEMIYSADRDPGRSYYLQLIDNRLYAKYQQIIGSRHIQTLSAEQMEAIKFKTSELLADRYGVLMPERPRPVTRMPTPEASPAASSESPAPASAPAAAAAPAASCASKPAAKKTKADTAKATPAVDAELAQQIADLIVDDCKVLLPTYQLTMYAQIKKILVGGGGKYNKGGFFTFRDEASAQAAIDSALGGKSINLKKDNQFFATPTPVGRIALSQLGDITGGRVLEPEAGDGALADLAVQAGAAEVVTVEAWDVNAQALRNKGYTPYEADFLSLTPESLGYFDFVLMNPPFTKKQDIDHVKHALSFLQPDGVLSAVMATSFQHGSDKKSKAFREILDLAQETPQQIESGAFKASGTSVATVVVRISMADLLDQFIERDINPSDYGLNLQTQLEHALAERHTSSLRERSAA